MPRLAPVLLVALLAAPDPSATTTDVMVRPTEIDVKGHLNHAKPVEYLQWGRWEWLEARGLSHDRLAELGVVLVVVNINLDYRRECRSGEKLAVVTRLEKVGEKSVTFRQQIIKPDGSAAVEGSVVLVAIDPATRRSRPLPPALAGLAPKE